MGRTKKFDLVLFLASLAAGLAAWIVGNILYSLLSEKISQTFLVGIEFFLLFLILTVTVLVVSAVRGTLEDFVLFLDERWKIVLFLIVGGILFFVLSSFFQFLYGLNSEKVAQDPTSYIFVIDNSGSTQESDPNFLRYQAIEEVIAGMPDDFPYMIYGFSDDVRLIREMKPVSEGLGDIPAESSGGTSIRGALTQVFDDYENKVWEDNGYPKVILLTDGYATDIGLFSPIGRILKKYAKANISISAVGLGEVDRELMENIADTTNGIFLQVEDVSQLKDAMTDAAKQYSEVRNLLSVRTVQNNDWLYAVMRVAFLTLLGLALGMLMLIASTKEEDAMLILISSAVKSFVGALFMEAGLQGLGVSSKVMWLVLWILIAALLSTKEEEIRQIRRTGSDSNIRRTGSTSNISRY